MPLFKSGDNEIAMAAAEGGGQQRRITQGAVPNG